VTELWPIDLARHAGRLAAAAGSFCPPDEHARARGYADPAAGAEFLASRAALRLVLARYRPGPLRFVIGPHGKPALPGGPQFNLSRTASFAAVAVGTAPVGLDIERRRPVSLGEPAILQLAARLGTDPLDAWVVLEAWVKHAGTSLAAVLDAGAPPPPLLAALDHLRPPAPACHRPILSPDLICACWTSDREAPALQDFGLLLPTGRAFPSTAPAAGAQSVRGDNPRRAC
jgi:4'-phosphopantetheinyl transferase